MHCWFAAVPVNCSHKRISRIKIPDKLTVKYIRLNSQLIYQCHWLWLCFALLLSLEIDVVYSSYNTISLIIFQVLKKRQLKRWLRFVHYTCLTLVILFSDWGEKKHFSLLRSCLYVCFIGLSCDIVEFHWNPMEVCDVKQSCHLINWLQPST